jgi:hypothetical protein
MNALFSLLNARRLRDTTLPDGGQIVAMVMLQIITQDKVFVNGYTP